MIKKVYCKNCKHEWHWGDIWWCCRKNEHNNKAAGVKVEKKLMQECEQVNKDNNCFHYERKLWKFWIKN